MPEELSDQELVRRAKRQELIDEGIDPYPARSQRTHTAAQAMAEFEAGTLNTDTPVSIVGRLMLERVMGKAAFAHLEDGTGRIQIYLKQDTVGLEAYEFFKRMVDLGDFLGVTGPVFRTKTGEITVQVRQLALLSKALKPLPDKWHGLKDVETRYRQRYVDLLANEEVRRIFTTRARIVSALRRYLDSHGFLEVETPILQPLYGGAAARPFTTHHNQLKQDLYLRISFELYLKRLLVGGFERVYEIGRDFRNEGISFKHNPEFTMLEFYEAYADYNEIMRRTEEMIAFVADEVLGTRQIQYAEHSIDLTPPWQRMTMREAVLAAIGIDVYAYPEAQTLSEAIRAAGKPVDPKANRGKLIENLFSDYAEATLIQPTFISDYPYEISPLAKRTPGRGDFVERFEIYMGGVELANAFSELNDPVDQLQRFTEMSRALETGDAEAHPVDEDYVRALSYGLPPTGGFGMGIDRLTMLFTNQSTVREVILFPHLRSIKETRIEDNRE